MRKKNYLLFFVFAILCSFLFSLSGCGGVTNAATTAASASLGGMEAWVFVPGAGAKNVSHPPKVTPPSGFVALPGAILTIVGTGQSAVTDSTGYAYIGGLASGAYTVTVAKNGYETFTYNITVSTGIAVNIGGSGGIQTEVSTTPGIMDLSAVSGVTTASITITGVNFSSTQGTSTVTFGGVSATTITSWSSTQIVCTVPVGAVTGNVVVTVNSEASNGVPFTVTGEGLPSAPSNLTATAVSITQINLSWTANSANETGFKIERKPGASGTYAQIATVGAGVTTYNNTGVSGGINYYYRVRAYNAAGNSGYSNETNVLTTLPAPSGLTTTAISSSRIDLSWTSNSTTETGFKIERKTGSGGAYVEIATVGAGVTSYNNTGITEGTTYYYRVRAYNDTGDSGYSNEANASTALPAPSGLAATAASSTQINLAWTRNSTTETGFKIERKTDGTYAWIATVGAGVTSYENTGLSGSTKYYYRVRAYNDTGDSGYSNEANATTAVAMTLCPAVTYSMGQTGIAEPVHTVNLSAFYAGNYEVTNTDFCEFLNTKYEGDHVYNPEEGGTGKTWWDSTKSDAYNGIQGTPPNCTVKSGFENKPVVYVSWYGAVAYCNWKSDNEGLLNCYGGYQADGSLRWGTNGANFIRTNKGYRLPTEAEWEYACRGNPVIYTIYYWGDVTLIDAYCWYATNSSNLLHDVGIKLPNNLGLYDMSGNVWEWCTDWYLSTYYSSSPSDNPVGPDTGSARVIRGGGWGNAADLCRSADRNNGPPVNRGSIIGFRLVRTY